MPSKTKESSQGITRHYIKRVVALSQSFIHKIGIMKNMARTLFVEMKCCRNSIPGGTILVSSNCSIVRMPCHILCKDVAFDLYKVLHRCYESIHTGATVHVSSNYSFVRMPCHISCKDFTFDLYKVLHRHQE